MPVMTALDLGSIVLPNTLHVWESFMFHLDIEQKLSKEWDAYQTNTVAPIWQLRENLKFWMSEMQHYLSEDFGLKYKFNPVDMLQQVGILTLQFLIIVFLAFLFIYKQCFMDITQSIQ